MGEYRAKGVRVAPDCQYAAAWDFPGNGVFPGLRHGFPFTRLTLAAVLVSVVPLTDPLARNRWREDPPIDPGHTREIPPRDTPGSGRSRVTAAVSTAPSIQLQWRERNAGEFLEGLAKWVSRTPSITRPTRRRTITRFYPATSLPRWDVTHCNRFIAQTGSRSSRETRWSYECNRDSSGFYDWNFYYVFWQNNIDYYYW